ncbi:MAG: xanthine dehydrogenase family protein molybdopterin-binding subunit, partial [Calditrichaceae bacterium]
MKTNPKDFRVDAADKLGGHAKYIRDEVIPGLWYGKTIRSASSHALIKNITFDPGFDWSTVVTVTSKDIPNNYVAMLENDMPFLAGEKVRYMGEPIVLIAAEKKEILEDAAKYVHVEYEELEPVFDVFESEKAKVKIFRDDNLFKEINIEKGDLKEAEKKAVKIIEICPETGFQEHLYLEPQGIIAFPEQERVVIKGTLQCPYYVKNALTKMFDDQIHITVIQAPTGGAFGGKEDYPSLLAGHAALLAVKSGHPVAIFYDREEDVRVTTKRHPSFNKDIAYVDKSGKLLGLDLQIYFDGGAYCTLSQVVLARAALTATNTYYVPHVRIKAKALATNTVPSGAFRGFGGPQAVFATEMLMEKIANELNLAPDEVRRVNMIAEGQDTATGQILKYSVSAKQTFEDVIQQSGYRSKFQEYEKDNRLIIEKLNDGKYPKKHKTDKLKGIGITAFQHGAGFTGNGENKIRGKIRVEISKNGSPVIFAANTEMGQGEQTAFRNIIAEALQD